MSTETSTTRWRDAALVPDDYDNVSGLIPLARKARGRIVEFDWAFTPDDLRRVRRAVFEWGSGDAGRYKCFDARVLAAINDALGDTDTVFVLTEPKNSAWTESQAACVRDGDGFRLRGHAPFDIVFGYGNAVVDPTWGEYLGVRAQETVTTAVAMLGWDMRRLQDERYRPVRNALFGLKLDYGLPGPEGSPGPAIDVPVHFCGPFTGHDDGGRCLFTDPMGNRSGVYLWTINVAGQERPWYVGQTRRGFGQRMGEHLAGYLSGQYLTCDAAALSRGENRRADGAVLGVWPQTIPSFLRNHERLLPNITELFRIVRFHVAPLAGDAHLHDRIEGAIGRHYKVHSDPELRDFLQPGLRLPAAIPYDTPMRLVLSSEAPIAGLPDHILA